MLVNRVYRHTLENGREGKRGRDAANVIALFSGFKCTKINIAQLFWVSCNALGRMYIHI